MRKSTPKTGMPWLLAQCQQSFLNTLRFDADGRGQFEGPLFQKPEPNDKEKEPKR